MHRVERVELEEFDWDENKRERTIEKSGVDFRIVASALLRPHIEDDSPRDGEPRTKAICMSDGRIIVVIFTIRERVCRIITAWPADKNEQAKYRQILGR